MVDYVSGMTDILEKQENVDELGYNPNYRLTFPYLEYTNLGHSLVIKR